MYDIDKFSVRLDTIEMKYRRLKTGLWLAALIACAVMLMGQEQIRFPGRPETGVLSASAQDNRIRAEAFILVDSKGNERASLVTDGSGSVFLVLFDNNRRPRADLQVSNYGPSLNFYDPGAKTRLVLGSTTLVGSHVVAQGVVEKNPPSSLVMFDRDGQLLWRTP